MPIAVAALQTPWGQAVDGEAPLQCPLPHLVQTHQPRHLCHSFITILEVNPLPPLPCSNLSPIHTFVHSHTKMAGLQFTRHPTMAFGGFTVRNASADVMKVLAGMSREFLEAATQQIFVHGLCSAT